MEQEVFAPPLRVTINVDPPDASLVVDGRTHKPGRLSLTAKPGDSVSVVVSKAGCNTVRDRLELQDGLTRDYRIGPKAPVKILVEPKDAIVKVDGRELLRGGTEGRYGFEGHVGQTIRVRASRYGYEPREKKVTLTRGLDSPRPNKVVIQLKSRTVGASLKERPSYGRIKAQAKPWAEVVVNGELWGRAPQEKTVVTGHYVVVLRRSGLDEEHSCQLDVSEGRTVKCFHDFTETR